MKIWVLIGAFLGLFTTPALAQQAMSGAELKAYISGKSIEFSDGRATYKADGNYEYFVKTNVTVARGKWSIKGDEVCVDFDDGGDRCDQYVKEGDKISLKNSKGTIVPVTAVK